MYTHLYVNTRSFVEYSCSKYNIEAIDIGNIYCMLVFEVVSGVEDACAVAD